MTRIEWFESRVSLRVMAGVATVALHLCLLILIMFSGGQQDGIDDGDTPVSRLVLIEAKQADRRDGPDLPQLEPIIPTESPLDRLTADDSQPPSMPTGELQPDPTEAEQAIAEPATELVAVTQTPEVVALESAITVVMPAATKSAIIERLARLAEELQKTPRAQVTWEQDGKPYQATLVLERAKNGIDFDHVVAEVSAEDRGRQLTTKIKLKRLAFSHYTQMIDYWDPMVKLHDDEVVGRFHVNSQFSLMYDGRTTPRFLGKVTTAANGYNTEGSGRRRNADIFRGGIETKAGRIAMPEGLQPFDWAPRDEKARVHEFVRDTSLRFFADGSYMWRDRNDDSTQYRNEPSTQPIYFIASDRATLYVQGVVSGKVLIYSPKKVVVEGNVTYAHDPRSIPESDDYLGLVSDGYVEIASPHVTGFGDISVQAAIFAGRRFIVRDVDQPRKATLRILGSLAAGTVTASEPRYAMKVEYDNRFEQQRPPGFPSTNRFSGEEWDGQWTETPLRTASQSF